MIALIAVFWGFMGSITPKSAESNQEDADVNKEDYINRHKAGDITQLVAEVKRRTYGKLFNIDDMQEVEQVCEAVREAEAEVHSDAEEAYTCILRNHGGDHPLTERLADPSGGKVRGVKKKINTWMGTATRWYGINVTIGFVFLCLHYFDYIKDIGKFLLRLIEEKKPVKSGAPAGGFQCFK